MKMWRSGILALLASIMISGSVFSQGDEDQQLLSLLRATPEAAFSFYDPLNLRFGDFQQAFNSNNPLVKNSAKIYLMAIIDLAESTQQMCSPLKVKPLESAGSFNLALEKVPQSRYQERAGVIILELLRKYYC
ncbi:MAG: hypothetical protein LBF16_06775 [Pseudomonadales bacterium]|jgi:hypothetical protein|nr:hypothetical protein [Pseudomonadales bacterium]